MDKSPSKQELKDYQNNPFFIATDGLELLFKKAQSVGIFLAILTGIGLLGSLPTYFTPPPSEPVTTEQAAPAPAESGAATGQSDFDAIFADGFGGEDVFAYGNNDVLGGVILGIALVALLVIAFIVIVSVIVGAMGDYTAAKLARDQKVGLSEAFKAALNNFFPYLWIQVIVFVKVVLWSLLFIIPGIIMSVRYSLAGTTYFDKGLKGNEAVKSSLGLTKGAWLTTYSSRALLNLLTFGAIPEILRPGTNAVLFRQFDMVGEDPKPKAHPLAWVALIVPIVLFALFFFLILALVYAIANYASGAL